MKVEFPGPLWVDDWEDQGAWVLLQDLTATVTEDDGTVMDLTVPSAFITDFCSIPRLPFVYDIFGNIARKSGALHDFLYQSATQPREWCDLVLRAALRVQGVPDLTAESMYLAVRAFGGPHYGKEIKMRSP